MTRNRRRHATSPSGLALRTSTTMPGKTPRCRGTTVTGPRLGASARYQLLGPVSVRTRSPRACPRSSTVTATARPTIASGGASARTPTPRSTTPGQIVASTITAMSTQRMTMSQPAPVERAMT